MAQLLGNARSKDASTRERANKFLHKKTWETFKRRDARSKFVAEVWPVFVAEVWPARQLEKKRLATQVYQREYRKRNKKQKLKARDKARHACRARVAAADEAEGSEDEAEESPSVEMLVPPSQGANGTISIFWHASLRNLCCHGHHCFHCR